MKRLVLGTICIIFLITAYSQAPLAQLEGTVSSSIIKSSSLSSLVSTQVDTGFIFLGRDPEPPHLLRLELLDLPSGKRITSSLSIGLGLSHYSEADIRQSPDGKWIGVKVGAQLFVVDSALQNHIIVPLEAELRSWTWSPDSSSIAILLGADDHNPSLYSFNLESFYLERLDIVRRLGVHKAVRSMAWSPDGSKIILFSSDTGKLMYLVDILANSIEQLPKEEMCGGAIGTVKWSPDGQWIAIHFPSWGGRQGAYSRLCAYNLAEKTFFPIEHSINKSNPVWSLDSQSLYFVINEDDDGDGKLTSHLMHFDTVDRQTSKVRTLPTDHAVSTAREVIGLVPDGHSLFLNLTPTSQLGSRIGIINLEETTRPERVISIPEEIAKSAWLGDDLVVFIREQGTTEKLGRFYRVNLQTGTITPVSDLMPEQEWELFIQPKE